VVGGHHKLQSSRRICCCIVQEGWASARWRCPGCHFAWRGPWQLWIIDIAVDRHQPAAADFEPPTTTWGGASWIRQRNTLKASQSALNLAAYGPTTSENALRAVGSFRYGGAVRINFRRAYLVKSVFVERGRRISTCRFSGLMVMPPAVFATEADGAIFDLVSLILRDQCHHANVIVVPSCAKRGDSDVPGLVGGLQANRGGCI